MGDATIDWAALSAQYEQEFSEAWPTIVAIAQRQVDRQMPVRTGFGGELIVNTIGYGRADEAEVLAHTATPIEATLTEDGRHFVNEWHAEPVDEDVELVYYERWEPGARVAHGFLHPETRRLVQAG